MAAAYPQQTAAGKRWRNASKIAEDPFKIVIVRDMWLTGFDAPCLHTMYLDKPMRGHGLMQAIARVNRVFKDKPGGLVVDYLGLARRVETGAGHLHRKRRHTADGDRPGGSRRRHAGEIRNLLRPFPRLRLVEMDDGKPAEKLVCSRRRRNICSQQEPDGINRNFSAPSRTFTGICPVRAAYKAIEIRDDVGFFQAVRAALAKSDIGAVKSPGDIDAPSGRSFPSAVASDEVMDIFAAAGLKKPDISILSDDFLAEVRGMPQKNLAVELLRKLLNNEIKLRSEKT